MSINTTHTAIVITTIASPNKILKEIAKHSHRLGYQFIIVGDQASPKQFHLKHADFYGLHAQLQTGFQFTEICPTRHYSRKNIGYLLAIKNKVSQIFETDDDNLPLKGFGQPHDASAKYEIIEKAGWVNIYKYFSNKNIWPRGFALEALKEKTPPLTSLKFKKVFCPVQQGLADKLPDADAIYYLLSPQNLNFKKREPIILKESWCPFNSQNTLWFKEAFPLLYLPSYCPFRLTDIWRSFIAQRIIYENNWGVLFHGPTVSHERNQHNIFADFSDEILGYLNNYKICKILSELSLKPGEQYIPENLYRCYEKLVSSSILQPPELPLLKAWLQDVKNLTSLL